MSLLLLTLALSGTMLIGVASFAQAADRNARKASVDPVAGAEASGPWMIRGRALVVNPQPDASLSVSGDVNISTSVVPELDISYFFTPNLAAELVLGATPHRVKGAGDLDGIRIGSAWLLPPPLMLQHHFTDLGKVKPYIGAGINTHFSSTRRQGADSRASILRTMSVPHRRQVSISCPTSTGA